MSYVVEPKYVVSDSELIGNISSENKISWNEACDVFSDYAPMDGQGSITFYKDELVSGEHSIKILKVLKQYFDTNNIEKLIIITD